MPSTWEVFPCRSPAVPCPGIPAFWTWLVGWLHCNKLCWLHCKADTTGVGLSLALNIPTQAPLASRGAPPQLGFIRDTNRVSSYHQVLVRAGLTAGYHCVAAQPWRVPLAQCLQWLGNYIYLGYAQRCGSQLQLKPAGTTAQAWLAGTMTIMCLSSLTSAPWTGISNIPSRKGITCVWTNALWKLCKAALNAWKWIVKEKRSNEGSKVKQPEEEGITQEMTEEMCTRRKATKWTKHIKSPQGVKGMQIQRCNFGVNADGKIRLKPTYRVMSAWEETHWPFHSSYMGRRAIWMGQKTLGKKDAKQQCTFFQSKAIYNLCLKMSFFFKHINSLIHDSIIGDTENTGL